MSVKTVTDSNFSEFIKNDIVVVDCYASWCGPCRMLAPIIEELSEEMPEILFGKLDVDANPKTATQFGIMSIPTILFFKNGKHIDTMVGFAGKEPLKRKIEQLLE